MELKQTLTCLFFSRDRLPLGLGEVFLVIVFPLPKDMAAIREQGFLGKEKKG